MTESLFSLYCEACESTDAPSRLWVRAEVEIDSAQGSEMHHYVECLNCGYRFKSRMEDHMEAVDDEEWRRFVGEPASERSPTPIR